MKNKLDTSEFGRTVRKLRERRAIGLREMAERIGASQGYLSQVERGNYAPPSEEKIVALADALETNATWLLALGGRLPSEVNVALLDHFKTRVIRSLAVDQVSASDTEGLLPEFLDEWLKDWRGNVAEGRIRTRDFYLASFLVGSGFEPVNVSRDSEGVVFEFADEETQRTLVNAYYARVNESAILPLAFVDGMKKMQRRLRELEDDDDSK
jgi:transcriptional regulator with XRE-family HTH domain